MSWTSLLLAMTAALLDTVPPGAGPIARPSIAVLRLDSLGVAPGLALVLSDEIARAVKGSSVFETVRTPAELDLLVGPQQQDQLRACANDACVVMDAEIAGVLGATHLMSGRVVLIGDAVVVQLKIIELRTGLERASQRTQRPATQESQLLGAMAPLVRAALRQAFPALLTSDDGTANPLRRFLGVAGAGALVLAGGSIPVALGAGALAALLYVVPYYLVPVSTPGVPRNLRPAVVALPSIASGLFGVGALAGALAAAAAGTALLVAWGLA